MIKYKIVKKEEVWNRAIQNIPCESLEEAEDVVRDIGRESDAFYSWHKVCGGPYTKYFVIKEVLPDENEWGEICP